MKYRVFGRNSRPLETRSPFDRLRANGGILEVIRDFPFMLSLSKHESRFFQQADRTQRLMDAVKLYTAAGTISALLFLSASTIDAGHGRDDDVDVITVEQVKFLIDSREKLVLVDLRPAADFKQKHLPGARSIPLTELKQRFSELPRAGRIVVYCDCRPSDEADAFFFLRDQGHRNIAVLQQGFARWVSLRYPLEEGRR